MGIKRAIRRWLQDDDWSDELARKRVELSELRALLKANMVDDAWRVRELCHQVKKDIQARAPKPLWRRYKAEHVGKNYGRLASVASLSPYPEKPTLIVAAGAHVALPGRTWAEHDEGGFIALQHVPIHPHHKLPVIDFGATVDEALFNLNQQLMQVALHEGWTIKEPTQ